MKTKWIEEKIHYDGSQLRSLYAYLSHSVLGDSMIAWEGGCNVAVEHMVDGEDKLAGESIAGDHMLHFLVERFSEGLSFSVAEQRLIAAIAKDLVIEISNDKSLCLKRDGDDIFWGDKKMSISIATVSPVSALVHFAVNVSNEGTPVKTCALKDFGIEPKDFALELLSKVQRELDSLLEATQKVHWVK